jgi:fluoride ion exporter CrcB/FEX
MRNFLILLVLIQATMWLCSFLSTLPIVIYTAFIGCDLMFAAWQMMLVKYAQMFAPPTLIANFVVPVIMAQVVSATSPLQYSVPFGVLGGLATASIMALALVFTVRAPPTEPPTCKTQNTPLCA